MDTEELFTVYCVNCNVQPFKFSKNLLESNGTIYLKCPKCNTETTVKYEGYGTLTIYKE